MKKYLLILYIQLFLSNETEDGVIIEINNSFFDIIKQRLNNFFSEEIKEKCIHKLINKNLEIMKQMDQKMPFDLNFEKFVIQNNFEIGDFGISQDNEFIIKLLNFQFVSKLKAKYDVNSMLQFKGNFHIKGLIKSIRLAFIFRPLNKENPKPFLDFKDFNFELEGSDWKFQAETSSDYLVQFSSQILSFEFIKNSLIGYIKNYILNQAYQIDILINENFEKFYPLSVSLGEYFNISSKLSRTPQFGGIKHKRMRLYLEGILIQKNHNIKETHKQITSIGENFLKTILTSAAVNQGANFIMDEVLNQYIILLRDLVVEINEVKI